MFNKLKGAALFLFTRFAYTQKSAEDVIFVVIAIALIVIMASCGIIILIAR